MMTPIIKLSNDYENFLAQFIMPSGLFFEEELVESGRLEFSVPLFSSQVEFIQEFRKVSLFVTDGVCDELVWTGYIDDFPIEKSTKTITVQCGDEKDFLRRKIIFDDKNYVGTDIGGILNELVTEVNLRAGNSFYSYETNLSALAPLKFSRGQDYFTILNDLAQYLSAEWTVRKGKIIFKSSIGMDKTNGSEFFELVSNKNSPNETNINYRILHPSKNIATRILAKDDSGQIIKSEPSDFGTIEKFVTFNEGDLSEQAQKYIDKSKLSQKEYEIEITDPLLDFRRANIGDKVALRINDGSTITDIEDSTNIIFKRVDFSFGQIDVQLKVSNVVKRVESPANIIGALAQNVNNLLLK